jgi:hypothetical protein
LKLDNLAVVQAKLGKDLHSGFRGEDFWTSLLCMMDGCQVTTAHMTLGSDELPMKTIQWLFVYRLGCFRVK